jgi:hypothetical protein
VLTARVIDVKDDQAETERTIFMAFVLASDLPVHPTTVQNRRPPEPDILCEIDGVGPHAFELIEIIDADFARLTSDQLRLDGSLREAARQVSNELASFSNALVYVRFVGDANARRREAAIPLLFSFLRSLPPGFGGDVTIPQGTDLAATVRSVRVSRGDFPPGPHFQVEAGSFIGDPIIERLAGKFSKRYATNHQVDLLAFYEMHPVRPPETWIADVGRYVATNLTQSQFSRVWIFDVGEKRVLFRSDRSA